MSLDDKSYMYCLWVAKDPVDFSGAALQRFGTLTLANSQSETVDDSLGEVSETFICLHIYHISQFGICSKKPLVSFLLHQNCSICNLDELCVFQSIRKAVDKRNEMRIQQLNHVKNVKNDVSIASETRADSSFAMCQGSYNEKFCTLEQIGTGAFGYVKTAFRRSDRRMVVTKFIKRSKVFEENWVNDSVLNMRVPLEISILSTLDHPNIVRVLDVHENEDFLQLVMERHGAGMDLFEFLERRPKMDEALCSFIFRQVWNHFSFFPNAAWCVTDVAFISDPNSFLYTQDMQPRFFSLFRCILKVHLSYVKILFDPQKCPNSY